MLIEKITLWDYSPISENQQLVVISRVQKWFKMKKDWTTKNWIVDNSRPTIDLIYLDFNTPKSIKILLTDFEKVTWIMPENCQNLVGAQILVHNWVYVQK